jgi:hypothetical protein
LAVSPVGPGVAVYAQSANPQAGDGILLLGTNTIEPIAFIPLGSLSGAASTQPFHGTQARPPMQYSKDGRLLYVAAGLGIRIINMERMRVVRRFRDLPPPYDALSRLTSANLRNRQLSLQQLIADGAQGRPAGTAISDLALAPDGRTLYVLVQTGMGGGSQPGYVIPVNVDLYRDAGSGAGLQSRLLDYFTAGNPIGPTPLPHDPQGDEPSSLTISPDGRFLYVANGGVVQFSPPGADPTQQDEYALRLASTSTTGAPVIDPNLLVQITADLRDGSTIINAPGLVEAYTLPAAPLPTERFRADVNHGHRPSAVSGGLVRSPKEFGEVFAKRPFSMSIRPDGKRALISFFQTGNFGVMDLEGQRAFDMVGRNLPEGLLAGVVAVTPALTLDKNLWPQPGPLSEFSPEERLMFPMQVQYAQSGRFAAAVHTGVKPLFGFPTDVGGGAVSLIDDDALDPDIRDNAQRSVTHRGHERPYYATFPLCIERSADGTSCARSPVTTVFEYRTGSGATRRFARPRAVTVAPILQISEPRFGDYIRRNTEINVRWSASAAELRVQMFDLGAASGPATAPNPLSEPQPITLDADQREFSGTIAGISPSLPIVFGHRYRLTFELFTTAGSLAATSIDVVVTR